MKKNHCKTFLTIAGIALLCAAGWLVAPSKTAAFNPIAQLSAPMAAQSAAQQGNDQHAPELPSPLCDSVQAPAGNKVSFHVYARGVQIYRWNGDSWDFVAPVAKLYADANFHGKVGIHYGGPTWESNSGSTVIGSRVAGCTPDSTAIPWLLLRAVSAKGPGIFSKATYIQRVNTTGGLAPATSGSSIGEVAEVPYTAEYYFYRGEN